ncbi:chord-domain-containing protein [Myriangium duriaei CBS 260.36]|uniref:Chord-domain-containing protein n=1 Tax=Myriangium duriaei CBS 260.36 TaxID=1168546 RepID=A0A9P4IYX2_9PEZI|nr:chord-domain-containing protein [Myriangium duriaei CBS 260.36]
MPHKCVHKGCGKEFADIDDSECVYHPGPPIFHEGQKGWKCCKPRVLTFDEFMNIPPCTTGKHSEVDDTPAPEPKPTTDTTLPTRPKPTEPALAAPLPRLPQTASASSSKPQSPAPPEDESDDPTLPIPSGATCKRRGCNESYEGQRSDDENCVHHPGQALFHEGSKGWTCCKRRVLEFDEFLKIEGCKTKPKHCYVGKKKEGIEELDTVRHDFYQTPSTVIASLYLKKVDKEESTITFSDATTIQLDLKTSDRKSYKKELPLYASIDTDKSTFKVMGTKIEFTLVKADGTSWPVLRSDQRQTGEIIQMGRAGRVQ